jgi:hypothetical protein
MSPGEKAVLKRLSDEQGRLGTIMKKFIEKFEKAKEDREKEDKEE